MASAELCRAVGLQFGLQTLGPLLRAKRTLLSHQLMSANDPKRTCVLPRLSINLKTASRFHFGHDEVVENEDVKPEIMAGAG